MKLVLSFIIIFLFSSSFLSANDEQPYKLKLYSYIKQMGSYQWNNILLENPAFYQIHNRINAHYYRNDWKLSLELRNRIMLLSDNYPLQPRFEVLSAREDFLKMSLDWNKSQRLYLHSIIDRLYYEKQTGDWNITLGRQRINWGINLAWNPNDIFNAYSFFDFDYEERQGVDGVLIRQNIDDMSFVEYGISIDSNIENSSAAVRCGFNYKLYDMQFILGKARQDYVLGFGWAGNIKQAGFKGEMSLFNGIKDQQRAFVSSVSLDYTFNNGIYLNASHLYNSQGADSTGNINFISNELSAKNLSPLKQTFFIQAMYPLSPVFQIGNSVMSSHDLTLIFLNPSLSYSLRDNLDLDAIVQYLFMDAIRQCNLYIRFKYVI